MDIKYPKLHQDDRGMMMAAFELGDIGEVLYATIKPGKFRGNHYHEKKFEMFCVLAGDARFYLRNIDSGERREYDLSGDRPAVVEIHPRWTHKVENIGEDDVVFIEWGNQPYDPENPDSYQEEV